MRCMRSTHVSESTGSELTESGRNIWNCPGNITSWAYAGTSCASLRQIRGEASGRPWWPSGMSGSPERLSNETTSSYFAPELRDECNGPNLGLGGREAYTG